MNRFGSILWACLAMPLAGQESPASNGGVTNQPASSYVRQRLTVSVSVMGFSTLPLAVDWQFNPYFALGAAFDAYLPFRAGETIFTLYPRFTVPLDEFSALSACPFVNFYTGTNYFFRQDLLTQTSVTEARGDIGLLFGFEFRRRLSFRAQFGPVIPWGPALTNVSLCFIIGLGVGVSF